MEKKKCVLFVRVSTEYQDYSEQTIRLSKYAELHGYPVEKQITVANKESGTKRSFEEREGFAELFSLIDSGEVSAVFVAEVSRIGRRDDVIARFKRILIENKINLYVQQDEFRLFNEDGTLNTNGIIMFNIVATLAEREMIEKKSRFSRGKARAVKEGRLQAGSPAFGYQKSEDGTKIVECEEEATCVRDIFKMYAHGKSMLAIYDSLVQDGRCPEKFPVKTDKAIKKGIIGQILANASYCGRMRKTCATRYPAIITEELFDEVAEARKERKTAAKVNTKYIYFAKGLIYFQAPNRKLYTMMPRRGTVSYGCPKFSISIGINLIDTIVLGEARYEWFAYQDSLNVQIKNMKARVERECKEMDLCIKDSAEQMGRLNELYIRGRLSLKEYNLRSAQIIEYKNKCEYRKVKMNEQLSNLENYRRKPFLAVVKNVNDMDDTARSELVHAMIEKCVVSIDGESRRIEVHTKSGDINVYRYFPQSREIEFPTVLSETYESIVFKGKRMENPLMEEFRKNYGSLRIKTRDFVILRFRRYRNKDK